MTYLDKVRKRVDHAVAFERTTGWPQTECDHDRAFLLGLVDEMRDLILSDAVGKRHAEDVLLMDWLARAEKGPTP